MNENYELVALAKELANCTPMTAWEVAISELLALKNYTRDWDGDDADSVPERLIQSSLIWFRQMRDSGGVAPDAIVPTYGGTIMMEWFREGGAVTSAEVRVAGRAEMLDWQPDRSKCFYVQYWTDHCNSNRFAITELQSDEPTAMCENCFALAA